MENTIIKIFCFIALVLSIIVITITLKGIIRETKRIKKLKNNDNI